MCLSLACFTKSENGAVTVDWVVLTAALILLPIFVMATVSDSALDQSTGVGAYVAAQTIPTYADE